MRVKLALDLRNRAQQVDVVKPEGSRRDVLGTSSPQLEERRNATQQHWGGASHTGRSQQLTSIVEPLPQRTQTILSYQLDPVVRRYINTGMGSLASTRKSAARRTEGDFLPPDW